MVESMSGKAWAEGTKVNIVSGMTRTQTTQVIMASKTVIPITVAGPCYKATPARACIQFSTLCQTQLNLLTAESQDIYMLFNFKQVRSGTEMYLNPKHKS